jgi:glutamate-1-semialdehyde 2,1-aminomutase
MSYTFNKSKEMFKRATKVVPKGIYGHHNPSSALPGSYPYFISHAKGSRFWDIDGNEYIDYLCAYGPMILGYAHDKVDEAFAKQAQKGTCTTTSSTLLVELAEKVVDTIDCADWAMFSKNGCDATSWAMVIARAYAKRNKMVLAEGGYHGSQPWAGTNHAGITPNDRKDILMAPWGDITPFEQLVAENKGEIAGVMFTPYHHPMFAHQKMPEPGYWAAMRKICDENDIVLIIDDVRAGFRLDIKGSAHYFGVKPDLACFSKAIANGYALSAVVGSEKLKIAASKVFQTGTYWFNSPDMAAALACLDEMGKIDAAKICHERGIQLRDGLMGLAKSHGLQFAISGPPAIPFFKFENEENYMRSQLFCKECSLRGVYFLSFHNMFVSAAHTEEDIKKTLDIADAAFKVVKHQFGG